MIPQIFVSSSQTEIDQYCQALVKQHRVRPFCLMCEPTGNETIGVEKIRNLITMLLSLPSEEFKLLFINRAEKLTPEAQSALLKTLEEPPSNLLIVLCCSNPYLLLPTVVSRSTIFLPTKKTKKNKLQNNAVNLKKILDMTVGEKLKLAENLAQAKDGLDEARSRVIDFLNALALDKQVKEERRRNLKKILVAKEKVIANANLRLVLDVFFLSLS